MTKQMTQTPVRKNEVNNVQSVGANSNLKTRINEEGLFNLFTADIMKMKTKFTR